MKNLIAILAFLLLATPALAQNGQPIRQGGNVTPRHVSCWTTNGIAQDCGTAAFPYATGFSTWGSGPTLCAYSAIPGTAPYNQICLGATQSGGGVLSLFGYNGGSGGLTFNINGTIYSPAGSLLPSSAPANTVLAGPSSGSAAAPTFRSLVVADLPNIPSSIGGLYGATVNAIPYGGGSGQPPSFVTPTASSVLISNGSDVPAWGTTLPSGLTIPAPTLTGTTTAGSLSLGASNTISIGSELFAGTSANDAGGGLSNTWLGPRAGPQSGGSYSSGSSLGTENVAIGFLACASITTGAANECIGGGAGLTLQTGSDNQIMGQHAARVLVSGSLNTLIGNFANQGGFLGNLTTTNVGAVINASISGTTLTVNSVTSGTVAIGQQIGGTGIPSQSGIQIISGSGSTWTLNQNLGTISSESMTTFWVDLSYSTCIGSYSCYYAADLQKAANPGTAGSATALGYEAYYYGSIGQYNIAIGTNAMNGDSTNGISGSYNIGVGLSTCNALNTGSKNICIGASAGYSLASGSNNLLLGTAVGYSLTASNDILIGYYAGFGMTSGTDNIEISNGDPGITTGSYNVVLGNVSGLSATLANAIVFGDGQGNIRADYGKTGTGWTLASGLTLASGVIGIPQATWADNQTCTVGQFSVDASYIYVCTASNTVRRAALSTF